MGSALLENWKKGPENFTIVDPGLNEAPEGVRLVSDRSAISDQRFDVIVVAVKPQMIAEIVPQYSGMFADDGYMLSIAAGASIDTLKQAAGDAPIVRVMPNLPAAIGAGVSGICASADVTDAQLAHAREMMERNGTVVEAADEDGLDRITAIAGSGPGYVFEIARAYVAAAMELGFDENEARDMVLGTMQGTISMAQASDQALEDLRNSVTSKNGTTAAGLAALNGDGAFDALIKNTLEAAYDRAVELR